jgi:hypothetical protein
VALPLSALFGLIVTGMLMSALVKKPEMHADA